MDWDSVHLGNRFERLDVYFDDKIIPFQFDRGRYYIKDGWLVVIDASAKANAFNLNSVVRFVATKRDDE